MTLHVGYQVLYPGNSVQRVEPVTRGHFAGACFWVQSMVRSDEQRRLLFEMDLHLMRLRTRFGETAAAVVGLTGTHHRFLRMWLDVQATINPKDSTMKFNIFHCTTALLLAAASTTAFAHGDVKCEPIPKAEWKPQMDLQKKLVADGWRVRQVKVENGCYEVYGFDAKGKRVEAFFNPKTFERVEATK